MGYNSDLDLLIGVGIVMLVILAIITLILLACYIVNGWSLYNVAKERGENKVFAWIPILNIYLLYKVANGNLKVLFLWFAVLFPFINLFLEESILLAILMLVYCIAIFILCIYDIILRYRLVVRYGASKVCYFIGLVFFPCTIASIIQIGLGAKRAMNDPNRSYTLE